MKQAKSCQRCGQCCCNILIFEHEATKIKGYLRTHPHLAHKLLRPFDHNGCIFLMHADENDTCTCAIYDSNVRPTVCQIFATKGFNELSCPNGFESTRYTKKQAKDLVFQAKKRSQIAGTINEIMKPFIAKMIKDEIMQEIFKSDKN